MSNKSLYYMLIYILLASLPQFGIAKELTNQTKKNIAIKIIPIITTFLLLDNEYKQLKKTGQTKSYDENGNEVTNGSLKDDGYYQKGITPNYTRDNTKEVVIDHITNLMWQDNSDAKTVKKPWLTQENYDKCTGSNGQTSDFLKCFDTSGDTAATYCANLTLGGYNNWRLPTIKELESIVNYGNTAVDPTIDINYFKNVAKDKYSSITTMATISMNIYAVDFFVSSTSSGNEKDTELYVRCVRSR